MHHHFYTCDNYEFGQVWHGKQAYIWLAPDPISRPNSISSGAVRAGDVIVLTEFKRDYSAPDSTEWGDRRTLAREMKLDVMGLTLVEKRLIVSVHVAERRHENRNSVIPAQQPQAEAG